MLLLTEEDIDPTALVYIAEFVVFGSVSHLFTLEQQATIAHAMRSEVCLNYIIIRYTYIQYYIYTGKCIKIRGALIR